MSLVTRCKTSDEISIIDEGNHQMLQSSEIKIRLLSFHLSAAWLLVLCGILFQRAVFCSIVFLNCEKKKRFYALDCWNLHLKRY